MSLRRLFSLAGALGLTLALGACADDELNPGPSSVSINPPPSQPREPKKTAEAPPPIREHREDTTPITLQMSQLEAAQITSSGSPGSSPTPAPVHSPAPMPSPTNNNHP